MSRSYEIIDFHAHILPGADHGSSSVDTTLEQLNLAQKAGVSKIIATPHFYPHIHTLDSFLEKRDAAYRSMLPIIPGEMEIRLGAEVLICPGIENLPELDKLFVSGTNTLLLELSTSEFSEDSCASVCKLIDRGVNVVLAHADRYPVSYIERMIGLGAKIQLNAVSLNTLFKRKPLYSWLARELVVALGSDIHGRDSKAYPALVKAYRKIGTHADYVARESQKIWNNSSQN